MGIFTKAREKFETAENNFRHLIESIDLSLNDTGEVETRLEYFINLIEEIASSVCLVADQAETLNEAAASL